jgi:hypothetical protein
VAPATWESWKRFQLSALSVPTQYVCQYTPWCWCRYIRISHGVRAPPGCCCCCSCRALLCSIQTTDGVAFFSPGLRRWLRPRTPARDIIGAGSSGRTPGEAPGVTSAVCIHCVVSRWCAQGAHDGESMRFRPAVIEVCRCDTILREEQFRPLRTIADVPTLCANRAGTVTENTASAISNDRR